MQKNKPKSTTVNERGSALIITLLLVALLVSLVVEFAYEVFIDTSAFANWNSAQKASSMARSGQILSSAYLADVQELSHTYEREIDLPLDKDFGAGSQLSVIIKDESAKFNINSIILSSGVTNREALSSLKKLMEYLNINSDLALLAADWIDPDSDPRMTGSENNAKNTFLWSLDELKLIEGMDNAKFDKISPFITVYGDNIININTAELPVLVSLIPDMTEHRALNIINYREATPFEHISDIMRVSGLEGIGSYLMGKNFSVKSSKFRVTAEAKVDNVMRVIESVMDTSLDVQLWREG